MFHKPSWSCRKPHYMLTPVSVAPCYVFRFFKIAVHADPQPQGTESQFSVSFPSILVFYQLVLVRHTEEEK